MPEAPDMLAEDFDPRDLPLYKKTCARVDAASAVAKDFAKSLGKDGVIKDDEALSRGAEVLTLVQDVHKELEENRLSSTKTLRQSKDKIDDTFKEVRGPVESVVEAIKAKIARRNRELKEQAAEAQAALEEKAAEEQAAEEEAAAEEGREAREIKAPEVEQPTALRTSISTVAGTNIRKYRVIDFSKMPDEFKKEDKGALNRAAKGGRENVPGVEFYYDDGVSVTKR